MLKEVRRNEKTQSVAKEVSFNSVLCKKFEKDKGKIFLQSPKDARRRDSCKRWLNRWPLRKSLRDQILCF